MWPNFIGMHHMYDAGVLVVTLCMQRVEQIKVIHKICLLMSSNWCHNHPQTCCFQSARTHWKDSKTATNMAMTKKTNLKARQCRQCATQCERNSLSFSMRNIHYVEFFFHQFFIETMRPLVHIFMHTEHRLGGKISFAFSCFVSLKWRREKKSEWIIWTSTLTNSVITSRIWRWLPECNVILSL